MGNLINREELLQKKCKEPARGECVKCDWYGDSHCPCEIFGTEVDSFPPADATPIIHAQWEDGYGLNSQNRITYWSIDCPVCRNVFKSRQRDRCEYWKERFHYCPFCGAKMDIGREKEDLIDGGYRGMAGQGGCLTLPSPPRKGE